MLPPMPPILVPISIQQPSAKPRPDINPVTPTQASAQESGVTLDRRHPQELQTLEYEKLQREADAQQQSGHQADERESADGEKSSNQESELDPVLLVEEVDFSERYTEGADKERPGLLLDVHV